jgi:hypothetical protein
LFSNSVNYGRNANSAFLHCCDADTIKKVPNQLNEIICRTPILTSIPGGGDDACRPENQTAEKDIPMQQRIILLIVLASLIVSAGADESDRRECADMPGKTLAENEILFAYSVDGKLDALTLFNGREFLPVDGREFRSIAAMYDCSSQKGYPVSLDAYRTRLGKDRCIWFARLPESAPVSMTIFSSKRMNLNTKPDPKVVEIFYSINTDCVGQGDPPPDERKPCTKPELLATSDLNFNGRPEFWYSTPYTWNTGFSLAELSGSGQELEILSSRCLDCD